MKVCTREIFKGRFYRFFRHVPDVEGEVSRFWKENLSRVYSWYLERWREDDLIVSASPNFLILPASKLLGIATILAGVLILSW